MSFCAGPTTAPLSRCPTPPVTALAGRTEGWAAGLQLAALSLRGRSDVTGFMDAFTGSHRYVLDYLAEEVLERESPEMRRFLLETSVLDRLSGPCVTRSPVVPTARPDSSRWNAPACSWFRSMIFGNGGATTICSLTCYEPDSGRDPGEAADLHRRAAAWYEDRGPADDAIHHAVAGRGKTWAARLIERTLTRSTA